jgi:hypothetical protein
LLAVVVLLNKAHRLLLNLRQLEDMVEVVIDLIALVRVLELLTQAAVVLGVDITHRLTLVLVEKVLLLLDININNILYYINKR